MKRWKLCDLVPPGTSGELQGLLCLLVMICAFLYSVWKYAAALTHGLETAARSLHRMTDFADLIGAQSDSASFWTPPVFFPLTLVVLAALLLIPCNYYAFWRGAKSIYLMRRLPDRWELARRCLAIPLLTVAWCPAPGGHSAPCFLRNLPPSDPGRCSAPRAAGQAVG